MPPRTNTSSSTTNRDIRRHFDKIPAVLSSPHKASPRMKYKWYSNEASENVTLYQRPHILGCAVYKLKKEKKVTINN